ncbi:hypothetical protein [Rhodococcoides kroppenstedtii]|uniref:hypothetical protein n=1 Tax=Rhodococcoides kroppenstedtii TaxID=293050 RepID=UPI003634625E
MRNSLWSVDRPCRPWLPYALVAKIVGLVGASDAERIVGVVDGLAGASDVVEMLQGLP